MTGIANSVRPNRRYRMPHVISFFDTDCNRNPEIGTIRFTSRKRRRSRYVSMLFVAIHSFGGRGNDELVLGLSTLLRLEHAVD
jgi:hypothetical protein